MRLNWSLLERLLIIGKLSKSEWKEALVMVVAWLAMVAAPFAVFYYIYLLIRFVVWLGICQYLP